MLRSAVNVKGGTEQNIPVRFVPPSGFTPVGGHLWRVRWPSQRRCLLTLLPYSSCPNRFQWHWSQPQLQVQHDMKPIVYTVELSVIHIFLALYPGFKLVWQLTCESITNYQPGSNFWEARYLGPRHQLFGKPLCGMKVHSVLILKWLELRLSDFWVLRYLHLKIVKHP
jgi:hypothetical protein